MTFIIISLIVALLGGIVTLFFSSEMVGELYTTVFDCGQYLTTVSGVEFFSLLMPVSYGFGISLIILKFLKKAFDIYVLWTDGDPDADPFLLLTNFVRAVGTALIFQWLYGLFVDICREITNTIISQINGGTDMTTEWVTAITSMGIVPAIAGLIFVICWLILYFSFMARGIEMMVMQIGVPLACVGLLDNDKGVFRAYINQFVRYALWRTSRKNPTSTFRRPIRRFRKFARKTPGSTLSAIGDLAVHLKTLQTFFRLYIPSMDDRLRAILDQSLVELYFSFGITWETDVSGMKAERFPILSDLYKLISCKSESGGRNVECYADLKTYLEGAANGADHLLWNGYTTINPTSGFIVLDTKSLIQMSGTVLAAQYFNVLSWCWEQITRDRKERIMLIADECWTMIDPRCPQSLEFLKNAEKRARKYEGSIVVGTQSTNDFLDPEVKFYGQSVLDLPTYKLLFSMDGQSLKEAAELFDLNDSQTELISSGQRGMALMKVGRQAAKVRFVLSDERLEMFGRGGGR